MIATLALRLFGAAAPTWLTAPIKWLIDIAMILAVLGGVYAWIYHSGEKAGGAKIAAKVEKQHAKTVAEAVADTGKAQVAADAINAHVKRIDQQTTDLVTAKIKETNDAIDATTPVGGAPAVLDTQRLSASINALVDRANGEAEAADAQT